MSDVGKGRAFPARFLHFRLWKSAFSPEGLAVSLNRTADGRAKATVTPDGEPLSFFLRVSVR